MVSELNIFVMQKLNSNQVKILELRQVCSFVHQCALVMPKI